MINKYSFYAVSILVYLFNLTPSLGQAVEVPLDKRFKNATVLEFEPPYQKLVVYIEDDLDMRYSTLSIEPSTLYLKRPLNNRKIEKLKDADKLQASHIRKGMMIDLRTDHYQRSLKNKAKEIVLAENYYTTTSVKGLFEFVDGGKASVDGQMVVLKENTIIKGLNEWRDKTFSSFNELQLGCELDLQGKRETDGIIYVTRGTARPIESNEDDRLLRKGLDIGLKIDKNYLHLGKSFSRKLITDPSIQDYVNSVGRKIVPEYIKTLPIDHPDHIDFKYYLVEDESLNASAFPNGVVIIHTGLLKRIDNEAQLAAVLGHEIAHVTQKHHSKNYRKRKNWSDVSNILTIATLATGRSEVMISTLAVNLASDMYVNSYSRTIERQADRIGLRYMYDGGYDAREAAVLWKKFAIDEADKAEDIVATNMMLEMMGDESKEIPKNVTPEIKESIYASHPKSRDRFNNVNFLLSTSYSSQDFSSSVINEDRHRKMIARFNKKGMVKGVSKNKKPTKSKKS